MRFLFLILQTGCLHISVMNAKKRIQGVHPEKFIRGTRTAGWERTPISVIITLHGSFGGTSVHGAVPLVMLRSTRKMSDRQLTSLK